MAGLVMVQKKWKIWHLNFIKLLRAHHFVAQGDILEWTIFSYQFWKNVISQRIDKIVFFIFRWKKCVGVASSDSKGFGMAAGHVYIKKKFDEESRKIVSSYKKYYFSITLISIDHSEAIYGLHWFTLHEFSVPLI